MKRIITIAVACALACTAASAQSGLSSLLGKLTGSSSSTTTSTTATTTSTSSQQNTTSAVSGILNTLLNTVVGATTNVTLAGNTYTYAGTAVALKSDNTVASLASSTVNQTIQNKLDAALAKVGIKAGAMTMAFATDGTFTCTVKNIPLSGTYTQEEGVVNLEFGKTMKFLKMQGAVVATTKGVQIVFEGDKYLTMIKNILAAVGTKSTSATTSTISSLLATYNGLSIGFDLTK